MGEDQPAFQRGKLGVLAGGIVVAVSDADLPAGEWATVRVERRSGIVTIGVRGSGKHDGERAEIRSISRFIDSYDDCHGRTV